MNNILQLYQKLILDHQKNPRNFGRIQNPTHMAEIDNPICGDHVQVDLKMSDCTIDEIKFRGRGCAISIASASIMTEVIRQKELDEILSIYLNLKTLIDPKKPLNESNDLSQKLRIFESVRRFPSRMKCATLGWEAVMEAVEQEQPS